MVNAKSSLGWLPALFDIAVVSLDCTGTVLECSEPALAVLSNGGLSINDGKLIAHSAGDQESLQRIFDRAKVVPGESASARVERQGTRPDVPVTPDSVPSPSFVGAIHIGREAPLPPLQIVATTTHSVPDYDSGLTPTVMLFLCDPVRQHSSRSHVLRSLYRLTPTEMRLTDQLVSGAKLKNAAKALNLTENTARFHLKEIFRKMRVDCQSALLSTILLLPSASDVTASVGAYGVGAAGYDAATEPYKLAAGQQGNRYNAQGKVFA